MIKDHQSLTIICWLKCLVNRIPFRVWQIGLLWGDGSVEWSPPHSNSIAVVFSQEACDSECSAYNCDCVSGGSIAVSRRIWISKHRLGKLEVFQGF